MIFCSPVQLCWCHPVLGAASHSLCCYHQPLPRARACPSLFERASTFPSFSLLLKWEGAPLIPCPSSAIRFVLRASPPLFAKVVWPEPKQTWILPRHLPGWVYSHLVQEHLAQHWSSVGGIWRLGESRENLLLFWIPVSASHSIQSPLVGSPGNSPNTANTFNGEMSVLMLDYRRLPCRSLAPPVYFVRCHGNCWRRGDVDRITAGLGRPQSWSEICHGYCDLQLFPFTLGVFRWFCLFFSKIKLGKTFLNTFSRSYDPLI